MPTPPYILNIRTRIGHDLLLLPAVSILVTDDRGQILMQRRADDGNWSLLGGICEPGEEPADTVVREVREETTLEVAVERLSGVYATPVIQYGNQDLTQFITIVFVCRWLGGIPKVNDDESLEFRFFPPDQLPKIPQRHRIWIEHALENRPQPFFIVGRTDEPP